MHERYEQSRGFSLIEVIVATLIATMVISGLAYTFGLGRGFIDRYEIARAALAEAQGRMEQLAVKSPADFAFSADSTHLAPFNYQGQEIGIIQWSVADEIDPMFPAIHDRLKNVTVEIIWSSGSLADTVRLTRIFPAN